MNDAIQIIATPLRRLTVSAAAWERAHGKNQTEADQYRPERS